jgi:hypothetical protein
VINTPTPELDKQRKVIESGEVDTLGNFYDWLQGEGYHIAEYVDVGYRDDRLAIVPLSPERLFANYFDIDLNKIETERRAILEKIRSQ